LGDFLNDVQGKKKIVTFAFMSGRKNIWDEIEVADRQVCALRLSDSVNYDKFYLYSLIAHSTAIEGSTLSERDARLLFDEGITKKGSLIEHLMNLDLKNAYEYAIAEADKKWPFTPEFLKELNALVMKNTGGVQQMPAGTFDTARGDFRLCGVTAGFGGKSYMDYKKVPEKVAELCRELNKRINTGDLREICDLSFDAHLNLVTIHPWMDGNGRTGRLLMNYIQFYHGVTPTKIHREDKAEYIKALEMSQQKESSTTFREFMAKQHLKTLREEIRNAEKNHSKNNKFPLLF
jgi:Fic family protein